MSRKGLMLALWGLVALAILAFAALKVIQPMLNRTLADELGRGDYELQMTDGGTFTEDSLKGAYTAVFFGFTHCPEVCPTTLGDIATWQEDLGEDKQLRVYFVTVDPERDDVDTLRDYVSWAPGVTGVSGSRDEIDEAIKAFRVYARQVELEDGDYTMDHSASVLLFDQKGRFFEPIGYQEDYDRVIDKIRRMQAS
ncbi:protein SCO1/2 [Pseudooceanicola antarcticus]|uniref:Protein SCO1/2 n=1 Tax=Pseudooceanicola antarcticus TaxID=1247613 RepID=A0A285ITG1_9RHOB|nr:SCO family protein [Pseudooceanicola antarcticus]PJE31785.1 SCO family protein [Pseudooceanicola antarcticus]SNY50386.1 protein SCO1/2 [Pseudooceanicola antarcticus]